MKDIISHRKARSQAADAAREITALRRVQDLIQREKPDYTVSQAWDQIENAINDAMRQLGQIYDDAVRETGEMSDSRALDHKQSRGAHLLYR